MSNVAPLDHVEVIKSLLLTVKASDRMHALVVLGPAGWGKSTAIEEAMKASGVAGVHLATYSTPLSLFNFLHTHSKRFVVIDDSSGLFNDPISMAILKAATWGQGNNRIVRWGSTSTKVTVDKFEFSGKLLIVSNSFPSSPDAQAVMSRSFPCRIEASAQRAKELLRAAAEDKKWFANTDDARAVAQFLCARLTSATLNEMSYRTLQMGYELAQHNPNSWEALLSGMITSAPEDPKKLIRKLSRQDMSVKDQARIFEESTGLKRRTFFKYRKAAKVAGG